MPEVSGNGKDGTDGSPLKIKPRAKSAQGMNPSSYRSIIGNRRAEVKIT